MPLDDAAQWAVDVWRRGMAPEPQLTVSAWADAHRVLPPASAEPGPWRTARVPYLRAIMDALSVSDPCERVVVMAGAQLGKTEALLNAMGYGIAHAPGTILFVLPSEDAVGRTSLLRIDPLIEHTPVLAGLVTEKRSRASGNTIKRKLFPGGVLEMTSAGSAIGLRSIPVRFLYMDEVDAYPHDVRNEGDPVSLAIQRTATYRGRRKICLTSTPTLKDHSRIERAYLESDQRRYFVPCPDCGAFDIIVWSQIQWQDGRRDQAFRVCPHCGAVQEERHKFRMLAHGEWRATADGDGRTVGFHLSTLYSPFETWGDVAVEHGAAKRDPVALKSWVNTKLAETWSEDQGETLSESDLFARRETWPEETVPDGVVAITAGTDTQDDRLETTFIGWGAGEECWVLGRVTTWGDPSAPAVWKDLDALLKRTWRHPRAVPDLTVRAACVDTGGHHTLKAYDFVRDKAARRIWGIESRSTPGHPLWPRKPSRRNKGKIPLFLIGADAAKDAIFARLKMTEPGPGYIHFGADLGPEYFEGLTSEKVVTKYKKGRPIREWVPVSGRRNEPLDCAVYALAALHSLKTGGFDLDREGAALRDRPMRDTPEAIRAGTPSRKSSVVRSSWVSG